MNIITIPNIHEKFKYMVNWKCLELKIEKYIKIIIFMNLNYLTKCKYH